MVAAKQSKTKMFQPPFYLWYGIQVHIADWYATFAYLAGVSPVDHMAAASGLPAIDSLNLWDLISGKNATSPRDTVPIPKPKSSKWRQNLDLRCVLVGTPSTDRCSAGSQRSQPKHVSNPEFRDEPSPPPPPTIVLMVDFTGPRDVNVAGSHY